MAKTIMTSNERHQMYLHDEIEKMLSSRSFSDDELELIYKVIKNSESFAIVLNNLINK